MDRYDFVREWFNASSVAITKYTRKDAAADMRNLRTDAIVDESPLPEGLSANYLYETINQLIKDADA